VSVQYQKRFGGKVKRRNLLSSIVGILFGFSSARATEPPIVTPGGDWNGRGWNALSYESKLTYVIAVPSSISMFADMTQDNSLPKACSDQITKIRNVALAMDGKFSNGEMMKQISLLYEDPANANIGVSVMFLIAGFRMGGETDAKINVILEDQRKLAATPVSTKQN
jgi:hypothetical protein